MSDVENECPDCGATRGPDDNYCRRCGMYLASARALTVTESRELAPARTGLPAPVKKAATAVAVGTALQIAVGLTGKYLARQAARQAGKQAASLVTARPKSRKSDKTREVDVVDRGVADPLRDAAAISETVMIQRVWIRRRS